jgi:N-acyl-D-amino-acid deacylase
MISKAPKRAPGFIDIHTHADDVVGAGKFMATIGVTTAIGGNCGSFMALEKEEREALLESKEDMMGALQSKEDLGALFARIDQEGYPVNLGMLIGNAALRYWVGAEDRGAPASEAQIAKMEQLAEVAMAQGAMGVSFGLAYVPGTSSQELRSLFRVAARHGGIASIHPRYHALGFPGFAQDAVAGEEELIEAARATGVKLQIGHIAHQIAFKAKPYDALVKRGLETIERARADGVDVTADCLPIAYFGAAVSESFLDMLVSPAFEDVYGVRIEDAADIESGPYKGQRLTRELFFRLRQEAPNTALRGLLI